ncbi:MAG: FAD-binding oxidoreductase, partial [Akkermansia sp.]|nr:FAD-binding oxidoreductase [Akkermansia sp.]
MSSWIQELQAHLGDCVHTSPEVLAAHSGDKWHASALPEAVVLATETEQVAKAVQFAATRGIPVTARGAGVGYVGGCVPVKGGIVVSVARMNRILEVNPADGVAVVEAGVLTAQLQEACLEKGWFYPPDPASRKESSIGGNIATNAGGPRCLKYGVTRAYVLGLEVVLPDGRILNCGGRTHKNKQGFDLVSLFCGSEGMLGIITKAILRIIPAP